MFYVMDECAMVFRDKERDREFQLELLRIRLKHEREVVLYSVGMAVGASFLVFALTLGMTLVLTEKKIPDLWIHMITAYLLVGGLILIASTILFAELKYSEKQGIERIRKRYLDW